MATNATAHARAFIEYASLPDSPVTGELRGILEKASGGTYWTNGTGSGQIDRIYVRYRTGLGAGATDSYNFLAAGSLTDIHGQAIDADELKALLIYPTSGEIKLDAPAADFMPFFADASDLLKVPSSGLHMNWGAAGLSLGTSAKIDVVETSGAATADYIFIAIFAQ